MAGRKLRVVEIYLSIQGEGPRVGDPTVFIRFGGCNLRCPLWPCDSQFAIDPKYRNEWTQMTPREIVDKVNEITEGWDCFNICLTGGEPFLQPNDALEELCNLLMDATQTAYLECFSNGTLLYPDWASTRINFVVDWKLGGSGEAGIGYNKRIENLRRLTSFDAIKFTIAGREDYEQARHISEAVIPGLETDPKQFEIFAGIVWGKVTNEELVTWMLEDKLNWRLNVQVHNHVWDRNKRGI